MIVILCAITINFHIVSTLKISVGGGWSLKDTEGNYNDLKATVPGGIYTDLMNNQIIGDVFYGYNDTSTRWVSKTNWTYYRKFTINQKFYQSNNINLVFEGLDTFANVLVNDVVVGESQNMFVRYIFNVKNQLKLGENSIEVQFKSPVEEALNLADEQSKNYTIPPICPPMAYRGECSVNQIRKMQASFSWDWGPAFPSMGIWKDVFLEAYNSSVIRYVVTNTIEHDDNWALNVSVYFDSASQRVIGQIIFRLFVERAIIEEVVNVNLIPNNYGEIVKSFSFPVLKANIRRWWPNGYGEQKLYKLTTFFASSKEICHKTIWIGFRNIELVQTQLANGLTFYFKVNDIPIFAKGANQIPLDILPEKGQNQKTVLKLLRSAKEANMNMLRVWGGGVYESDFFYHIADKFGLLIWQDFMFACALYPTRPEYLRNVIEEVNHQVKRLSSHPSIALWAGNNENEVALMTNWYNTKANLTLYKKDYIKLYIETIKTEMNRIASKAIFLSSSPTNGKESEREGYLSKHPQNPLFGDVHYYNYVLNSLDIATYPIPRFASEYGYQSLPELSTWLTTSNNLSDFDPAGTFMDHRQHHLGGYIENTLLITYQLSLPKSSNQNYYKAYIFYSQIVQAVSIKFETEYYRSFMGRFDEKGQGNTMGTLYWQLNDVWVAPTWSGIDYTGKWKMLQYYAKDFFNSLIITGYLDIERKSRIFVVSELSSYIEAILPVDIVVEVYKWDSFLPLNTTKVANSTIEYGKAQEILSFKSDDFLVDVGCGTLQQAKYNCFFYLRLMNGDISIAPSNWIFPAKLKDCNVQQATVKISGIKQIDDVGKMFEITITSDKIALFVWLTSQNIAGRFSENGFIQLMSSKTIYFVSEKAVSLSDLRRVLEVTHLKDSQYLI